MSNLSSICNKMSLYLEGCTAECPYVGIRSGSWATVRLIIIILFVIFVRTVLVPLKGVLPKQLKSHPAYRAGERWTWLVLIRTRARVRYFTDKGWDTEVREKRLALVGYKNIRLKNICD